ncbi:NUDIX hydrolase [Nocardia sp. alder85J]|uniref:NUDIX hydrolase n=1 Tax=Nocardia sp. alder85J TaxID=2862949 RepID=UPI001CD76EB8|nr:NUDIX domain-containing protein [Nocardia sp. alder85J]MCX4095400.1 NUDIX domain-containing protein [Nocardia sp. alder85J]
MDDWKYCPRCASPTHFVGAGPERHAQCAGCGYVKYDNPLPTTIGLVMHGGRILLLRRAIHPAFGEWDTVGGFLSGDETVEENLRREAKEEIGADIRQLEFVGSFSSVYGDTGLHTIGIAFTCTVTDPEIQLSEENSEYRWFAPEELPDVAFEDVRRALATLTARLRS